MFRIFLYVCGSGAVVVLLLALRETWRWRQGKSVVRGSQLASRWGSALILVALTVLILVGSMYKDVREFALGWLVALALISILVLIALIDLHEVAKIQRKRKKELLKDFRDMMEETLRRAEGPGTKEKRE